MQKLFSHGDQIDLKQQKPDQGNYLHMIINNISFLKSTKRDNTDIRQQQKYKYK